MLRQVAEGVLVHESEFCQSNAVVVHGRAGVLLIDPGVHGYEMAALANELSDSGQSVVAGFSTHPHWDHLLWHARLGVAPRYGTARCAATARDRLSGRRAEAAGIAEQVPLDLLGLIAGLPAEMTQIPWDGPQIRIVEHQAHAPGHAALLIEERGVLVAGDMLSDVLTRSGTTSPRCGCSRAWRATSMSSSPATGPSAELSRCMRGSTRIGRTCTPCVTPMFPATRGSAHRPRTAGNGWAASAAGTSEVLRFPLADPIRTPAAPSPSGLAARRSRSGASPGRCSHATI